MNLKLINLHPSRRLQSRKWRPVIFQLYKALCACPTIAFRHLRELNVVFTDDAKIAELNWRFLHHKGPTDILTFDYENGSAEIVISLDAAVHQASLYHKTLEQELTLYLAHGILHLAGINDQTPLQRRQMRKAEQQLLQRVGSVEGHAPSWPRRKKIQK